MKSVEIDHFKHYAFLRQLRTAPNGTPAFLVRRADTKNNRYNTNLWMLQKETPVQLTFCGSVTGFWWLDNETLLFAALRTQQDKETAEAGVPLTVLHKLNLTTPGEAEEFLRLEMDIEDIFPLPGGNFLATAQYNVAYEKALCQTGNAKAAAQALKQEEDYEVITELPIWNNGAGYASGRRTRLYMLQGGTPSPLTDEKTDVAQLRLCPLGNFAYFTALRYSTVAPSSNQLMQLDLATMELRDISVAPVFSHNTYGILPGGTLLVYGSDMQQWGINQNGSFYHLTPSTGALRLLDDTARYDCWNSVGTDLSQPAEAQPIAREDAFCWVATSGENAQIMQMDMKNGAIAPLTHLEGAVAEIAPDGDGPGIYFTAMEGLNGSELYHLPPGGKPKRQTAFNRPVFEEYALATPQPVTFTNAQGTQIRGWVLKPAGWQPGARYPAILNIHGGPKTVYGTVVYHEIQYWAAQGFGVLFCNPTGSDGRGAAFADIRGKYGTVDYEDLMGFVDAALAQHSWLDPQRLGVAGGSYGGFMTNWIIGHTTRFAAAVSQRSIASWVSMALTTDIGYYFEPDQAGATPWEDPAALWNQSPLKYANRVKTPTLFIHSEEDYRCWMSEAVQMYTALQIHGVPTRLCLFRGENHELSRSGKPAHRVRRLQEITRWFKKYLMNED